MLSVSIISCLTACGIKAEESITPSDTTNTVTSVTSEVVSDTTKVAPTETSTVTTVNTTTDENVTDSESKATTPALNTEVSVANDLKAYLQAALTTEFVPISVENVTVPDEAKAAYKDYLQSLDYLYGVCFCDLNADGIAEMVVGINQFGLTDVVSWTDAGLHVDNISVMSDYGGTWLVYEDGAYTILNRAAYSYHLGAAGYEDWYVYKYNITDQSLRTEYHYMREAYSEVVPDSELANVESYYGDAYVNDTAIDESTSNDLLQLLLQVSEKSVIFPYVLHYENLAEQTVAQTYTDYVDTYLN